MVDARPTSVVVASELAMVAETVVAGLAARGFESTAMAWPTAVGTADWPPPESRDRGAPDEEQVGLLISDLGTWERLWAAWLLVTRVRARWVVVTAAPRGPMWGATLDAGACLVLPSSTALKPVCQAIVGAAQGRRLTLPGEQESLITSWAVLLARREVISDQVNSLTPREHEVLTMLHAGDRITRIAQLLGVSPVTVRSQVKSVLRKLDVNSQLGAVAALDHLQALEPWGQELSSSVGRA